MARLNIKNAPLLTNILGTEKIPTGTRGDYAITPDLLATYFTAKLPFATKQELSQLKTNLENQISTVATTVNTGGILNPKKIYASDVHDQSGKTQQEINNYIVYAEMYGSSLNEAMIAISSAFQDRRVRVYVPSDFPVTDTVNLDVDCDLDLSSLKVMNDIDVIFEPMFGWSGSTTPCDVFCNNNSVRLGWNFDKDLDVISLNKCRFLNVGNAVAQTSASLFCGFYIKNSGIKRLDLHNPTTINSYVKPNGVIGDGSVVNSNIILTGDVLDSDTVSDINIYNPIAINLTHEVDADAIAINLGTGTASGKVFNIDIYNAYSNNCQKRLIKIQTGQQEKYITGVRLHGSMVGIGGGDMPYCCLDIYGKVIVEANGTLNAKGWLLGMQLADGAILKGDLKVFVEMSEVTHISGNTVRALNQVSVQGTTVDITEISGVGGGELFANNAGHNLTLNRAKHIGYLRNFSSAGYLDIKFMELEFKDPTVIPTRATYGFLLSGTSKKYIGSVSLKSTIATALDYAGRFIATSDVEINELRIDGVFNTAGIELVGCSNTKIRNGRVTQALSLVRATGVGGANVLLDQCKIPSGGTVVFANAGSPKVTNIIELNPINF